MKRFVLWLCFVAVLNASSFARPIQNYPYERLFEEADLVVIASATKTNTTADKAIELGQDYVGRNTQFAIRHTLKGAADGETIEVLHFKYVGTVQINNAPYLVDFRVESNKNVRLLLDSDQTPEYMLFLRRMDDGRYEAVSGQVDPVFSFRKLSLPPEVEKQRK